MLKFYVIVLCLLFVRVIRSDLQQDKKEILDELVDPSRYDPQIKPGNGNSSDAQTTVSINLHVLSVSQIDDLKMLLTIELYFRQEWKDERLQFDNYTDIDYITIHDSHKIWVPDIFFPNEHKSYFHDMMEANTGVKIDANGTVLSSSRITLVLRCPMHFSRFPFDRQVCSIRIETYMHMAEEIFLQWKSGSAVTSTGMELLNPLFNLDRSWTSHGLIATSTGEYSVLHLYLQFSRQMKYYILHLFVPCGVIFMVSCLAFWLNPRLMTARILIGLGSFACLGMLILRFDEDTPKAPYTRAIDIFTGMSMTFVFFSLIETIFVHLSQSKMPEVTPESNEISDKDDIEQIEKPLPKKNAIKQMKMWLFDDHQSLNDIDAASRVLFPICFVIFIAIYSITCAALDEPQMPTTK